MPVPPRARLPLASAPADTLPGTEPVRASVRGLQVAPPPSPADGLADPSDPRYVLATVRNLDGRDILRYVTLAPGEEVVLGRDPGCGLVLEDGTVSRQHARVRCAPDGTATFEDLDSRNGTLLNGEDAAGGVLAPGDVLEFGSITVRLERYGGAASEISAGVKVGADQGTTCDKERQGD